MLNILAYLLLSIGTAQADSPEPREADILIIRTFAPSDNAIRRFERIIDSNPNRYVILSVNVHESSAAMLASGVKNKTTLALSIAEEAKEKISKIFGNRVFFYSDEDMIREFPTLTSVPKFHMGGMGLDSHAYFLHEEAISLALKQFEERTKISTRNKGVWVLEDDVEYTGDWNALFDKYSGEADLISTKFGDRYDINDEIWKDYMSDYFRSTFISDGRFVSKHQEHVVYYSPSFRAEINSELHKGAHAQSEMFTATLCRHFQCNQKGIDYDDMDSQFYINSKHKFTQEQMLAHVKEQYNAGHHVLLHPVKY